MNNLYWCGVRYSDILGIEKKFAGSITIFGNNESSNCSLMSEIRENHNLFPKKQNEFLDKELNKLVTSNQDVKIMFYNPSEAYKRAPKILEKIVCLNEKRLYDILNNKIETQLLLENMIPILKHISIHSIEYNYNYLKQLLESNNLIVQEKSGAGGSGTNVVRDNYFIPDTNKEYLVTKYYQEATSYCVHAIIYKEEIKLFTPSVQIIKEINNKLIYQGNDFIFYQHITDKVKSQLLDNTYKIAKKLQEIGYLGVVGIDFISVDDEVFFIEVNPRFQASSFLLNKALLEQKYPSLQELNLESFSSNKSKYEIPIIDVNFSYLAITNTNKVIINPEGYFQQLLDGFNATQKVEQEAYLYRLIFNKSIINR